jgi:hypothetical protein
MKKIIAIIALIAAVGLHGFSQEKEEKEEKHKKITVPKEVESSFAKHYPGTKAKWELEDGKYEAMFKINGKEASAVFDAKGVMEESEVEISSSELPASTAEYMKTHYKGVTVKEVAKITKSSGEINYEVAVKGKDLIFDAGGKFLKEIKD